MSVNILPIKGEKYTPNQVQVSVSKVKINSREEQGLYYCDEKFFDIHSDIEKAIIECDFSGGILDGTDNEDKHIRDACTLNRMRREYNLFNSQIGLCF